MASTLKLQFQIFGALEMPHFICGHMQVLNVQSCHHLSLLGEVVDLLCIRPSAGSCDAVLGVGDVFVVWSLDCPVKCVADEVDRGSRTAERIADQHISILATQRSLLGGLWRFWSTARYTFEISALCHHLHRHRIYFEVTIKARSPLIWLPNKTAKRKRNLRKQI